MTHHDSLFREEIKKDAPKMPSDMAARFDNTIASFHSHPARARSPYRVLRLAALILIAVFLILPNLSPTIAFAMQEIPVIGDLIKVVTIYKKEEGNDTHYQDIEIPQIEASEGDSEAVDYINADVDTLTRAAIEEYESTVADLPDAHIGLLIDYEVVTNTADWFTLRLMIYQEAGSSNVEYHFYHIDKQKGQLVELSDLFRADFDYRESISKEIKAQMRQQHADNPNMVYWIDDNDIGDYVFETISENQNFYFNADGDLVIVFGKYEVAPGYMGCPEFVIPRDVYSDGYSRTMKDAD